MKHPLDSSLQPTRRTLLGSMTSAGLLAGICTAGAVPTWAASAPATAQPSEELFAMARLRTYQNRRSSSWDRSGANADAVPLPAGQSVTLLDTEGAGVITHLWFTIDSPDRMHLKNLVLRAWWDGEETPSIEAPVGDFFGLGLGEYCVYQSALLTVAPIKGLNAYFQMPYERRARITVSNEGTIPTHSLYYAVDYVTLPTLPEGLGRFHAQYRQAAPCAGWTNDWSLNSETLVNNRKNLDGSGNYVFLEATGRGHFLGVTQAVEQNQDGWFGEGDDMIFIDGDPLPTLNGTGSEDYFNGAWDFGGQAFSFQRNGVPISVDPERLGGRCCLYRWHTESPLAFQKSIRVTIEHGHANHRSDNFYSVAYWYQSEPHAPFPQLPAATDRIPHVHAVGGKAAATPAPAR